MATPTLIAQITDLHIKPPGMKAYGVVDTAAALERCVAHLNAFTPRPDFLVISGDLVDGGKPEEYAYLLRLLAPLEIPYAVIPGNHDAREPMRAAFARLPYAQAIGALNLLVAVEHLDVVLLDSSVPGKPHGLLDTSTLAWLDAVLAKSPDRPALIFLHHPPFLTGIAHMDRQNLHNADALANLVRRYPRVRHIGCGHIHRAITTTFAGVTTTICPAPNHAVDLDLAAARPPSFMVEPPAYHLHAWFTTAESGSLVTHLVPIGTFDGPHPFFRADGCLL
jgi:3',5'-cyclic AMP phosphodiesterase CpdA